MPAASTGHAALSTCLQCFRAVLWLAALGLAAACSADCATEVLFTSNASGSMQLHLMTDGGKSCKALTQGPGDNDNAAWSPDGMRIAFVSTRDGRPQVYLMKADGTQQRRVAGPGEQSHSPAWSPDSRTLAYSLHRYRQHGLYLQGLASGEERLLLVAAGSVSGLSWSPSGDKLAFATATAARASLLLVADVRSGATIPMAAAEGASNTRGSPRLAPRSEP